MAFSESVKLAVKKKANFTCCWCQDRRNKVDVHHIIPQADGGPDDEDNAAPLCGSCHDLYGNNPDLRKEIRLRRDQWYEICSKTLNPIYGWPIGLDVPLLQFSTRIEPTETISTPGIQLTDKEPTNPDNPPLLYLSIFFKESRYFGRTAPAENERWLYLEANMRFAFNLRIQVCAWNDRDIDEMMNCLRGARSAYNLQGPRPNDDHAGDYLYIGRGNSGFKLIMSTFTATNAGISIQARLADELAGELAGYLEEVGFTRPFNR